MHARTCQPTSERWTGRAAACILLRSLSISVVDCSSIASSSTRITETGSTIKTTTMDEIENRNVLGQLRDVKIVLDKMEAPLTPSRQQHAYSFRNTPTRKQGGGAYELFFKNAVKVSGGYAARKSLFNATINSLNSDDSVSVKSLTMKRVLKEKVNNEQQDYHVLSTDSEDDDLNAVELTKKPIKQIARIKPMTPAATKKTAGVTRRNTISVSSQVPSLQRRNTTIEVDAFSVYEKARIKLHVANTPDCLPCREKQFTDIYTFIESNIRNQTGGCMYLSGVPGTGKTLTTKHVISCLNECVKEKMLSKFKFVEVNAFQVTEPHQIYKLIYKELTDQNVSSEHAVMLLEKKFELKSSESVVLLVDELDMLCTKKQDILYNLFDWPYKKNSKWIVIAIANAMNLPEQVMINKVSSRLGLTRMTFQPYSHSELEEIVRLRLQELNVFENDAIMFAARKVAAVSGDARRALEICRRATELAEREYNDAVTAVAAHGGTAKKKHAATVPFVHVNIGHVDGAIQQMFSSPKINLLLNASLHEQYFMEAVANLYKKSGIEETTFNKIFEQHTAICNYNKVAPMNRTQLLNVCCSLGSSKLILLEPCNNIYLQRVRANMSIDDIEYVIKNINPAA